MLLRDGKKHLTKAEIEARRKSELQFGGHTLKCPDFVKSDKVALKKWKEVTTLYKDFDFVGSGDTGLLARYCKSFSEYQDLLDSYQRIKEIHYDCKELDAFLDAEVPGDDGESMKLFSYKVKKQLRDMISVNALLAIETTVNKKMDALVKMEDRLFLNPLAKLKSIPKKEKEEEPKSKWAAFGADKCV